MKTKRNWLAAIVLSILMVSLASPMIALSTSASEDDDDDVRIIPGSWYRLDSDIITVLFPAGGRKPMFIWWYTNKPDQVYVVKFQGLIEWFAFNHTLLPRNPETYNHMREAWQETWRERFQNWYFKPEENRWTGMGDMGMLRLMILKQMMLQFMERMENQWHKPYLPFDAGKWALSDIHNITTPEGKAIGVAFTFTLDEVWLPRFEFAEDNIMIRVRFYNETVEETVPGTDFKYTVNAGEMKMDLVVNRWEWNIDYLRELVSGLNQEGFDIRIPEGKSRLALWVNLSSINITRLTVDDAEEHPEEIEEHSTATHMEVEDEFHEDIRENKTEIEDEKPIDIPRRMIKIRFANETGTLGGFFRFVSSAKITDFPNQGDVNMVPVKAAYIAGGAHMRLYMAYPYFGNGTLEHDPSIGVETTSVDTTPKYSVQTPSGGQTLPVVIGAYVPPLFAAPFMLALIIVVSAAAVLLYIAKWRRKTPVNMVGVGTTG